MLRRRHQSTDAPRVEKKTRFRGWIIVLLASLAWACAWLLYEALTSR